VGAGGLQTYCAASVETEDRVKKPAELAYIVTIELRPPADPQKHGVSMILIESIGVARGMRSMAASARINKIQT
jgi:hypothetical protein